MATVLQPQTLHIYDFKALSRAPDGPCSGVVTPGRPLAGESASTHAAVKGQRVQVGVVRQPRGTGSGIHANPAEQFHYVLQGSLLADIDGQLLPVPSGHVVHIPPGMPHRLVSAAGEDAVFYTARDAGHPLGDKPGQSGTEDMSVPLTRNVSGKQVRYVYKIDALDAVPEGECSAKVTPNNFISKKSSSFGAALTGQRLHVGRIHKGVGSGTKLHNHPNEQFSFVLEGTMLYEIDGRKDLQAPPGTVTHLPPGIVHSALASAAGDVVTFVAKDTSHGMSGPPVDGIEDGPIYLPGFRPAAK
jgi:quercetin dioxygenase-like cupin family protein